MSILVAGRISTDPFWDVVLDKAGLKEMLFKSGTNMRVREIFKRCDRELEQFKLDVNSGKRTTRKLAGTLSGNLMAIDLLIEIEKGRKPSKTCGILKEGIKWLFPILNTAFVKKILKKIFKPTLTIGEETKEKYENYLTDLEKNRSKLPNGEKGNSADIKLPTLKDKWKLEPDDMGIFLFNDWEKELVDKDTLNEPETRAVKIIDNRIWELKKALPSTFQSILDSQKGHYEKQLNAFQVQSKELNEKMERLRTLADKHLDVQTSAKNARAYLVEEIGCQLPVKARVKIPQEINEELRANNDAIAADLDGSIFDSIAAPLQTASMVQRENENAERLMMAEQMQQELERTRAQFNTSNYEKAFHNALPALAEKFKNDVVECFGIVNLLSTNSEYIKEYRIDPIYKPADFLKKVNSKMEKMKSNNLEQLSLIQENFTDLNTVIMLLFSDEVKKGNAPARIVEMVKKGHLHIDYVRIQMIARVIAHKARTLNDSDCNPVEPQLERLLKNPPDRAVDDEIQKIKKEQGLLVGDMNTVDLLAGGVVVYAQDPYSPIGQ